MLVYQRVSKTTKTKMWVPLSSTILPLPGQEGLPRVVFFGYPKLSWVQHGSPKLRSELDLGDPYDLGSPKKNLGLWIFFSSSSVLLYSFIFSVWNPCCRTSGIPSSGRWQRRDSWHQGGHFLCDSTSLIWSVGKIPRNFLAQHFFQSQLPSSKLT